MNRRVRRTRKSRELSRRARRSRNPLVWATRHVQVMLATLGRLTRNPATTLMTTAVIGIAIALPVGLHLLIKNVQSLSVAWEGSANISLFMRTEVADQATSHLAERLRLRPDVARVEFLGRDQALAEFREFSGFGEALELLAENPLPAVLLVLPAETLTDAAQVQALADQLQQLPEVEFAQLDLQWVRRLHAITQAAQRGVAVLAALLALAVLLIVGNTIRLEIQNRHDEVAITRLVGATNGFIRRPFLYTGLWYGLFGGLIAWLMLAAGDWLLQGPVARIAGLYQSDFSLSGYSPPILLTLFVGSPLLGLLGAWLAVSRQLALVEPN